MVADDKFAEQRERLGAQHQRLVAQKERLVAQQERLLNQRERWEKHSGKPGDGAAPLERSMPVRFGD